jgi:hypothetical protein
VSDTFFKPYVGFDTAKLSLGTILQSLQGVSESVRLSQALTVTAKCSPGSVVNSKGVITGLLFSERGSQDLFIDTKMSPRLKNFISPPFKIKIY